jgi:hypothetical protein
MSAPSPVRPAVRDTEWDYLENPESLCFAVATLEVLLRCRALWPYFRHSYRPKTLMAERLRELFHAVQTKHLPRDKTVVQFMRQPEFDYFLGPEYGGEGSSVAVFLRDIVAGLEPDVGLGTFHSHTFRPDDAGVRRISAARRDAATDVPDPGVDNFAPLVPAAIVAFSFVGKHTMPPNVELPQPTRVIGGAMYHFVGAVIGHSIDRHDDHVSAVVRVPSRQNRFEVRAISGYSPEMEARLNERGLHFMYEGEARVDPHLMLYERTSHLATASPYADALLHVSRHEVPSMPPSELAPLVRLSLDALIAAAWPRWLWNFALRLPCPVCRDPIQARTTAAFLVQLDPASSALPFEPESLDANVYRFEVPPGACRCDRPVRGVAAPEVARVLQAGPPPRYTIILARSLPRRRLHIHTFGFYNYRCTVVGSNPAVADAPISLHRAFAPPPEEHMAHFYVYRRDMRSDPDSEAEDLLSQGRPSNAAAGAR